MRKLRFQTFWIFCLLLGCGSDNLYNKSSASTLQVTLHLVPESLLGMDGSYLTPRHEALVNLDEQIELWGAFHLENTLVAQDSVNTVVNASFWELNGDTNGDNVYDLSLDSVGLYQAIFHWVEFTGDTLRDTLLLYVNEPLGITLHSPQNNLLNVKTDEGDTLLFNWTFTGLDDWEAPQTTLYVYNDSGDIVSEATTTENQIQLSTAGLCDQDAPCRFWWRLKTRTSMVLDSETIEADETTSSTRMFQTSLDNPDSAQMSVQVVLSGSSPDSGTYVYSFDAFGNKQIWTLDSSTGNAQSPMLTPGSWTVVAGDSLRDEYTPESLSVSLDSGSYRNLDDSLILQDLIAPQEWLLDSRTRNASNDSLVFYFYDNGSGVDTSTLTNNWSRTVRAYTDGQYLRIYWTSLDSGATISLTLGASDNAGNSSLRCSWKLVWLSDSMFQPQGPYCDPDYYVEGDST
ncbi:MAG TPA: hypothetical protein VLM37_09355 [Fibrobacteraceae bacterium]|nr:hypothetical protein [Fibrobacteraceae bacterium]